MRQLVVQWAQQVQTPLGYPLPSVALVSAHPALGWHLPCSCLGLHASFTSYPVLKQLLLDLPPTCCISLRHPLHPLRTFFLAMTGGYRITTKEVW
jgi:hypothetical protein